MRRDANGAIVAGCGCGGKGKASAALKWEVNLASSGRVFGDGTNKKVFATAQEANIAIANVGLTGKVRPRPTTV